MRAWACVRACGIISLSAGIWMRACVVYASVLVRSQPVIFVHPQLLTHSYGGILSC